MIEKTKFLTVNEDKNMKLEELVKGIRSDKPGVRTVAWQQAGTVGASAVKPLAKLCKEDNLILTHNPEIFLDGKVDNLV